MAFKPVIPDLAKKTRVSMLEKLYENPIMSRHQMSNRQLKEKIRTLLLQQDIESGLAQIGGMPARKAINPLFSFLFCAGDHAAVHVAAQR
jgi:hypothetical protein